MLRRLKYKALNGSSRDAGQGENQDEDTVSRLPEQGQRPSPALARGCESVPAQVPQLSPDSDLHFKPRSASSGDINDPNDPSRRETSSPSFSLPWNPQRLRLARSSNRNTDLSSTGSEIGLHLVHDVSNPCADLILVHGLGGSWLKTWSWKRDAQFFWPAWLPSEDELSHLRIFSFGYNANFTGPSTTLGILDFAKDLLFKMSGYGDEDAKIGRAPIIFAAHSMGGLVVKKAYVLGTMDDSYSEMISRVFGVIFLATPHRGSDYAHTLNNLLAASMFSSSKTGSVLGYPSEVTASMDADHHDVVKFSSRDSPNYIALKDTLRSWVRRFNRKGKHADNVPQTVGVQLTDPGFEINQDTVTPSAKLDAEEVLHKLTEILGVHELVDLEKYQQVDGTCSWIQSREGYRSWSGPSTAPLGVLWLTGLPGTGKSTLAQSVVSTIKEDEDDVDPRCQYHFFTFTDATKRKVAYALRSIAFQLALGNHEFCKQLLGLHGKTGLRFEQQSTQVIWAKVFKAIIFKMDFDTTLYWVFDALDEADNPTTLVNAIFKANPKSAIRIFLLSRPARHLIGLATSPKPWLTHIPLSIRDTKDDVQLFIRTQLQETLPTDNNTRERVAQQMFSKASGSFLWAKLALKTLEQAWHTEEDIQRALSDIPKGMQALFSRMLRTIESLKEESPRNFQLAHRILTWATCCAEPLTTTELAVALEPDFTKLQNLEVTILHLCGFFITTSGSKVMPVHETAKSFLLGTHTRKIPESPPPFLDGPACHEHLAEVCIKYLGNESRKNLLLTIQECDTQSALISQNRLKLLLSDHPFLPYAAFHWAYHVSHADSASAELNTILQDFFGRHILSWIHACVILGGLRVITRSAQSIKAYSRKVGPRSLTCSTASLSKDDENFFQLWAIDLVRMVGRFGRNLAEKPTSIYKIIPPLCPQGSMIYKTYSSRSTLSLQGISSSSWDDCLARLPIGEERTISRVLSTVTYFICLISVQGEIIVCDTETCEELRRRTHGEYVPHMALNKTGSLLATAGIDTFRGWDLSSGEEVYRMQRHGSPIVMTLAFGSSDHELLVGYDDCRVVCYHLEKQEEKWDFLAEEEDDDDYHPCPKIMVFSPDITKLAIVFRGRPVLVWDITVPRKRPIRCVRESDLAKQLGEAWTMLDSIHGEAVEHRDTSAREMIINQDGTLLLTSDHAGTLSLWGLPNFQLLYRLPHEEFVRDLAFSPDSQRIYDVRGPICNIWEPGVLLRLDHEESEDASASGGNESETAVDAHPVMSTDGNQRSQITAIAYGPYEKYCVCGKDDGSVTIFAIDGGKKVRKVFNHATTAAVITLNWSPTGKYIASSGDNGRIITKRLETKGKEDSKWAVFPCLDFHNQESARQFTFNHTGKLMLISFENSDRLWNLKAKTQLWRRNKEQSLGLRWAPHPFQKEMLLHARPNKTTLHDWALLQRFESPASTEESLKSHGDQPPASSTPSSPVSYTSERNSSAHIRRIVTSGVRKYVIVEVLPGVSSHTKLADKQLRLELITPESLSGKTQQGSKEASAVERALLPISPSVRRFLGCYKDSIVFLNHEYWVCSWALGHPSSHSTPPKRHFSLPRDCIGPSSLSLVTLAEGGTVLFPKNGELAVVHNGLKL
ncbi:hypothetical protein QBC44DRAFT_396815 [Cladorrhinum sp. PSN332]|nr:hypothetical protein QBC44DRAFT_396815 [Cladorrhinum sp. PSN332]